MDATETTARGADNKPVFSLSELKRGANCGGSELSLERPQLHALERLAGLTRRFHGARKGASIVRGSRSAAARGLDCV